MITPSNTFLGIKKVDLTTNTSIAAGEEGNIIVTAPAGIIYKIFDVSFFIPAPNGAGSGTHEIEFKYNKPDNKNYYVSLLMRGAAAYNESIYTTGGLIGAAGSESPSAQDQQYWLLGGQRPIYISEDIPLYIDYENDTNVSQTGSRYIVLLVGVLKNVL